MSRTLFNTPRYRIIEKLILIEKLRRMYLEQELNCTGVYRSQQQILLYVARCPGASQKEIALSHHVSTATVAVSLKKLEKGGYITRTAGEDDSRFNRITITPRGQAVIDRNRNIFRRVEEGMFAGFSREELSRLEDSLNRIYLNTEYLMQTGKEKKEPDEKH